MVQTFQAHAPDIECDGCASSIKRSLGELRGVEKVDVDVAAKNVSVSYDSSEVQDLQIRERLKQAGFPVS